MKDDLSAITAEQASALQWQIGSLRVRITTAEAGSDHAEAEGLREKLSYCEAKLARFSDKAVPATHRSNRMS